MAWHKAARFVYLNAYSFLLLICGTAAALIPLYRLSLFLLIPQIIISLLLFNSSAKLFSTWKDKKIKYAVLLAKNKNGLRPESFKIFMQAPCGRLLAKAVLADLGIKSEYKGLLVYKEPFSALMKNSCRRTETKIYINDEYT